MKHPASCSGLFDRFYDRWIMLTSPVHAFRQGGVKCLISMRTIWKDPMQNRDKDSGTESDVQQRETAEFPALEPQEIEQWTSVKIAQMAKLLSFQPVDLTALNRIQGFREGIVLHIDSGTLVQAFPTADSEQEFATEPFQSIRKLASQRKFKSLTLSSNDTLYVAGVIPSQIKFLYVVNVDASQANYALTKVALSQVFS